MIVCGVEIKGKEAILALVQSAAEETIHVKCDTKKLALPDDRDTKSLLVMKSAIEAFALQHKVGSFVIKTRQATGPRAGGGITFKIETLFQLSGTPVVFISPQRGHPRSKRQLKRSKDSDPGLIKRSVPSEPNRRVSRFHPRRCHVS